MPPKKVTTRKSPRKNLSQREACEEFFRDPTKNPRTGKPVKKDGPVYVSLVDECGAPPEKTFNFADLNIDIDDASRQVGSPHTFRELGEMIKDEKYSDIAATWSDIYIRQRDDDENTILHLIAMYASTISLASAAIKTIVNRSHKIVNAQNIDGNTALIIAVRENKVPLILKLIDMHANVDIVNGGGFSALHQAVISDNVPVAQILLTQGRARNIKTKGGKAASDLARSEDMKRLFEGTKRGSTNVKRSPVKPATSCAEDEACSEEYVREHFNRGNVNDPVGIWGYTALHYIANTCDDIHLAKILVEEFGANVNTISSKYRDTPLMLASASGNELMVRYLLDKGADPNIRRPSGMTALYDAIDKDFVSIASLLIEKGARLYLTSAESNPFMRGVLRSREMWEVLKPLVPAGYGSYYHGFSDNLREYAAEVPRIAPFETPAVPREALASEIFKILASRRCIYLLGEPIPTYRPELARLAKQLANTCEDVSASPGVIIANNNIIVGEELFKDNNGKLIPVDFKVDDAFKFLSFGNSAIAPAVVKFFKLIARSQIFERNGANYRVVNGVTKIGEATSVYDPFITKEAQNKYPAFINIAGKIVAKSYIRPVDRNQLTKHYASIGDDESAFMDMSDIVGEQLPMRMPPIANIVYVKPDKIVIGVPKGVPQELRDTVVKLYTDGGVNYGFGEFELKCFNKHPTNVDGYLTAVMTPWSYTKTTWGKYSTFTLSTIDWSVYQDTPNMFLPHLAICKKFSYNAFRKVFNATLSSVVVAVKRFYDPSSRSKTYVYEDESIANTVAKNTAIAGGKLNQSVTTFAQSLMDTCVQRTSMYTIDKSWLAYRKEDGLVRNWHLADFVKTMGADVPADIYNAIINKYKHVPSVANVMQGIVHKRDMMSYFVPKLAKYSYE